MGAVRSYRDLIVWQKSLGLVEQVYKYTAQFPKEEIYGLTSQMRRASVSVPANIAEGQARNTTGEFKQQLGVAKGSLAELETLIFLSTKLNYLTEGDSENLLTNCTEVSKLLYGLHKSLPFRSH